MKACPLLGPIPGLSGWATTRVFAFAGRSYEQLMAGLAILCAKVLAAVSLLTGLKIKWSRHASGHALRESGRRFDRLHAPISHLLRRDFKPGGRTLPSSLADDKGDVNAAPYQMRP
jgi:hypothetical protein